jgi:uncharacterized protein (TIGR02646 family)
MLYIQKIPIADLHRNVNTLPLLNYINAERNPEDTECPPMHPSFDKMKSDDRGETKKALLKQLRKENYCLCCFCQKQVGNKFLIEHFLPQSIYKNEEVDYYNLFLCCNTKGQCSDAKKAELIAKFMTHRDCASFFKYTWKGEILPNCNCITWQDCETKLSTLSLISQQVFLAIKTLNLNKESLVEERARELIEAKESEIKSFQTLLKENKTNLDWLQTEKLKYIPDETKVLLPNFAGMFLFFIEEQMKKLEQKNISQI